MIFDLQSLFSDAQAVTESAVSENVIDRGEQGTPQHAENLFKADLGKGNKVPIRIQVVEDFAALTSLTVEVQVASDEAFSSPTTVQSATVLAASLVEGYVFPIDTIPVGTNDRYIRLNYDVTGDDATAGKITAGITMGNQEWYS